MTLEEDTEAALRNASPRDLTAVVTEALGHAKAPYGAAASLLGSRSPDVAGRALYVMNESRELGVAALLEVQGLKPGERAWQITKVTEAVLEQNRILLRWMRERLKDRAALPPRPGEPPRRVCDEAYLMMPRIMPLPEDHPARALGREGFFGLPAWRKDTLIRELEKSKAIRRILGEIR